MKFVVNDRADYEFARDVIRARDLAVACGAVLLSPVHGVLDRRVLSEWMLADRLPARLQLQLHKFIWSPRHARSLNGGLRDRIRSCVSWCVN